MSTNRVTGMYSGLDTESLVEELVKARSTKVENLTKEQTKLQWKQEKWKSLNTKISSFFSKSLANMRWATSYSQKTTSVSNSSAVSVITGEGAMNSTQTLSIKQLASTGYLTGAEVSTTDGKDATTSTTLASLQHVYNGGTADDTSDDTTTTLSGSGSFTVNTSSGSTTITIGTDTTISSIVSKLQTAGLNANFDEKRQRLYIGASASGADNDFTITADNTNGATAMSLLGINTALNTASTASYSTLAGYKDTYLVYDEDGTFNESATESKILSDTSTDIYKKLKSLTKTYYQAEIDTKSKSVSELKTTYDDLAAQDTSSMSDDEKATYEEKLAAAKTAYETANEELTTMNENLAKDSFDYYSSTAVASAVNALKDQIEYASTASDTASLINTGAVKISGSNALIELNGVEYDSTTNNVEVNGLTFTCLDVADNITVTTQDDTDGIYDMIKSFITEYNTLVNEMDSLYNADSTDLEPLTDEEKDAVTDTEQEQLETKIKDSLLRRDTTLSTIFNAMKEITSTGIDINGTTMYLTNFGIGTLSYFSAADGERSALHIDGDSTDGNTSGNTDKLKTMIANDPETVTTFFTALTKKLYTKLQDLSASSSYSSYGSFYDDKKYSSDLEDYEDKIDDAEEELEDYEDYYYDKFSAMETALSKLDSKSSYVSQLFS